MYTHTMPLIAVVVVSSWLIMDCIIMHTDLTEARAQLRLAHEANATLRELYIQMDQSFRDMAQSINKTIEHIARRHSTPNCIQRLASAPVGV